MAIVAAAMMMATTAGAQEPAAAGAQEPAGPLSHELRVFFIPDGRSPEEFPDSGATFVTTIINVKPSESNVCAEIWIQGIGGPKAVNSGSLGINTVSGFFQAVLNCGTAVIDTLDPDYAGFELTNFDFSDCLADTFDLGILYTSLAAKTVPEHPAGAYLADMCWDFGSGPGQHVFNFLDQNVAVGTQLSTWLRNDGSIIVTDFETLTFCVNNQWADTNGDGVISVFDLFCLLDALNGDFTAACTQADADLNPCGGNGTINIFDLFSLLDALNGIIACCEPL